MSMSNTARRDFLRLSGTGLAGAALPSRPAHAQTTLAGPNSGTCDVKIFGASGDGKTIDTPAINRAIEAAAAGGGGTVRFPAGRYLCYSIRLESNVGLHLEQGATTIAAESPSSGSGGYDVAEPKNPLAASPALCPNHWP